MRKIAVRFNKPQDIENLRTIMKNVYASNSDHLPDIAKFHFGDKVFVPRQVHKAELHITTTNGTEIKEFPKASLSFYLGKQHPFTKISMNSEDEGNYIILPWNLGTRVGRDNLKNLNERLQRGKIKELKYVICIDDNSQSNLNTLESSKDLSQSLTSLASLHLSDIAAEDETEGLLNKIGDLEQRLRARDNTVNSLTTQVANLQTQAQTQMAQLPPKQSSSYPNWTLDLPNNIGGVDVSTATVSICGNISILDWNSYANINNVAGSVTIDVVNRRLTIGGSSCGNISAY